MTTTAEPPKTTAPPEPYNLNAAIHAILDLGLEPDPGRVAELVFRGIPTEAHPSVIRTMLRSHVRVIMTQRRRGDNGSEPVRDEDGQPTPEPQGGDNGPEPSPKPKGNGRSAKNHRKRERFLQRLNDSFCVNEKTSEFKLLWQCTAVDLRALEAYRYEDAAESTAKGAEFGRLAEAVETAGVEMLGDLPEEQKRALLN